MPEISIPLSLDHAIRVTATRPLTEDEWRWFVAALDLCRVGLIWPDPLAPWPWAAVSDGALYREGGRTDG